MRIFLDTNAVLDYFINREPERHQALAWALTLCDGGAHEVWVSAQSVCDITYVVSNSRPFRQRIPQKATRLAMADDLREKILASFRIAATDARLLADAHANHVEPDFEDALIAEAARRVNAAFIVSSDAAAFTRSRVPKLTPLQLPGVLSRI